MLVCNCPWRTNISPFKRFKWIHKCDNTSYCFLNVSYPLRKKMGKLFFKIKLAQPCLFCFLGSMATLSRLAPEPRKFLSRFRIVNLCKKKLSLSLSLSLSVSFCVCVCVCVYCVWPSHVVNDKKCDGNWVNLMDFGNWYAAFEDARLCLSISSGICLVFFSFYWAKELTI